MRPYVLLALLSACTIQEVKPAARPQPTVEEQAAERAEYETSQREYQALMARRQGREIDPEIAAHQARSKAKLDAKCEEYLRKRAEYDRLVAEQSVVLEESAGGPDPLEWAEHNCELKRFPTKTVMRCTPLCFSEVLAACPEFVRCKATPPNGLLAKANVRNCERERNVTRARSAAPLPFPPEQSEYCRLRDARRPSKSD